MASTSGTKNEAEGSQNSLSMAPTTLPKMLDPNDVPVSSSVAPFLMYADEIERDNRVTERERRVIAHACKQHTTSI